MKQETLISTEIIEQAREEPKLLSCKNHRWVNRPEDFIEHTIKKSGKVILRCRFCIKDLQENKLFAKQQWQEEKEKLSDYYIRRTFATGKNSLPMSDYPEELVKAKRQVIQLKQAVKKINEPLKICSKHGKLFRENVIKAGLKRNSEIAWKCKLCMKELHAKNYEINKLKLKIKHETYRKENPEKVKACKKNWRAKNLEKEKADRRKRYRDWEIRNPEKARAADKKWRDKAITTLSDSYMRHSILRGSNLKASEIPSTLIEAKRAVMMLKRGLKKAQQSDKLLLLEEKLNGKD